MRSGVFRNFDTVIVNHDFELKKVLYFFLKIDHFNFFLMEHFVKVNKLSDSIWVFLELEVNVSDLSGKRLSSFEDLLRNGSDKCFIFLLIQFLDFGFEILYS